MTRAALSRVGSVLDEKYELVGRIGAGGMSEVYEAKHLRLGRRVAIKFLLPDLAMRPELIARFRNEARAAGTLQHENIAAVYDVGELDDGMQYLVMELLTGTDCAAALDAAGRFEVSRAIELVVQLCRGLSVAHAHDIVHRDLKPANLFVCQRADGSDLLKIFDFGIAKLRQSHDAELSTGTGAALGTPYYMSPEQARGDRDIDARTDVYSAGVILYELLSGNRPFEGSSTLQIIHRILTQSPVPLEQLRPDIPVALSQLVQRALAKERAERFSSASQLMAALQPFLSVKAHSGPARGELDQTQPDPDLEQRTRPRERVRLTLSTGKHAPRRAASLGWLVVGVVGLIGTAAWFWRAPAPSSTPRPALVPTESTISAALAQPPSQQSAQTPDAGALVATQPSAALPIEPAVAPSEVPVPRARAAKRPQLPRVPPEISAVPSLPPPAPEPPAPEPPARPNLSGHLKIDHSNPYQ